MERTSLRALGTVVDLAIADDATIPEAIEILRCELEAIDRAASRFRLDSEITALNESGGREIAVSPLFMEALTVAQRAAELTGGLVDPTIGGALVDAGYDRDFALVAPDGPPLALRERPVRGWRALDVNRERNTASLQPGARLDLGATAKALAADRAASAIAFNTGSGVAVSIGGDVAVAGPTPAGGWVVRIVEDPRWQESSPSYPGQTISIVGGGIATSGTGVRRWRRGAQVLHHIIDPSTGLPASSCWRTVSVAAGTCVDANIAATAAVLLGAMAAEWLSTRRLPARLVLVNGGVVVTGGWPPDAEPSAPPTPGALPSRLRKKGRRGTRGAKGEIAA